MLLDDDSPHFHFYFALSHCSVSFMVPLSEFFSYQNMRRDLACSAFITTLFNAGLCTLVPD